MVAACASMYVENAHAYSPKPPRSAAMVGIAVAMIVASTAAMKLAAIHAARIRGRRVRTAIGALIRSASGMAKQRMATPASLRESGVDRLFLGLQAYDQIRSEE